MSLLFASERRDGEVLEVGERDRPEQPYCSLCFFGFDLMSLVTAREQLCHFKLNET
jgi:hypothetical protein